jgi:hypothetical protein
VDEREWLTCTDPQAMLALLRDRGLLTERKARLFAVACCRQIWRLICHRSSQHAVELSEQYAEGRTTASKLRKAGWGANAVASELGFEAALAMRLPGWAAKDAAQAAAEAARVHLSPERVTAKAQAAVTATPGKPKDPCGLLRDLFRNPSGPPPAMTPSVLAWRDGTLKRLAEAAYEERVLPAGTLDLQRLAVLADALEEAGADVELVAHLREPGPHFRGCWVVDLLTGRQ